MKKLLSGTDVIAIEIKRQIALRGESITSLAKTFGCRREQLSYCVHGSRSYHHIRRQLADFLETTVEELFEKKGDQEAA